MDIVMGVLGATVFFLGVLAGIRASDWLLRGRERVLAAEQRNINQQHRHDDEPEGRRLYVVMDAEVPAASEADDDD